MKICVICGSIFPLEERQVFDRVSSLRRMTGFPAVGGTHPEVEVLFQHPDSEPARSAQCSPLMIAPSIVAGKPVLVQSPARNKFGTHV